ncbi:MAG: hypothetical protein JO222_04450 [Frankiales bacterium]|nr:hypothetical protein [Frankiales bacterium]
MTEVVLPDTHRVRARNLAPDSDNKIHDDDVAQQFGFSGALVPGVDVFAYATHPFVAAWGADFLSGGGLSIRFRRPVYDGDDISVDAEPASGDDFALTVRGPDGEARAVGSAGRRGAASPDLSRFAVTPPRPDLLPTGPGALPLGPLGSVDEPVDIDRHTAYLDGIDDHLGVYRADGCVHPGALLRIVNELLMRNVALGPWIHTASDCTFLATAQVPGVLHADGLVTDVFGRNGHAYVRYDALVRCDDKPVMFVDHTAIYRLGGPDPA